MINFLVSLGAIVVSIPFILVFGVAGMLWRSWWLYPAWSWFLVPLGIKDVSFWQFTAITFFVSTIMSHAGIHEDKRPISGISISMLFIMPVIAWGIMKWLH